MSDDDEIDRVCDLVVLSENYVPLAPGTAVSIGNIQGRVRHFAVYAPNQTKQYAIGIALSRKCDAIVATVVGDSPIFGRAEDSAFKLLNSQEIKNWIEAIPQSSDGLCSIDGRRNSMNAPIFRPCSGHRALLALKP